MISVITANYNGSRYLSETIESVLNQDFDDYEYIIVDDASTDNSREIINEYSRNYSDKLKPIFLNKNGGQGSSFNVGIYHSKGSIICFIDSDDLWFKTKLNRVYEILSKQINIALLQHNLLIMNGSELTDDHFMDILPIGDYFNFVRKEKVLPLFIPTSGLTFRRDILEKVLPIPNVFKTCADGYLTRTSFCFGDVAAINECLGVYRRHSENNVFGSMSHSPKLYKKNILFPCLNQFYAQNEINLKFNRSIICKIFETPPWKIIKTKISDSKFKRLEQIISKFG